MAIEIFGFIVKPEISIGDIAGIGALIASPLIFWFGYSRTRRSEQIKIARELMDRIVMKLQKLYGIQLPDTRVSEAKTVEVLYSIHDLLREIEYFTYLLKTHEIEDKNILSYCIPKLRTMFTSVETYLGDLKRLGVDMPDPPDLDYQLLRVDVVKDSMRVWFIRYPGQVYTGAI